MKAYPSRRFLTGQSQGASCNEALDLAESMVQRSIPKERIEPFVEVAAYPGGKESIQPFFVGGVKESAHIKYVTTFRIMWKMHQGYRLISDIFFRNTSSDPSIYV